MNYTIRTVNAQSIVQKQAWGTHGEFTGNVGNTPPENRVTTHEVAYRGTHGATYIETLGNRPFPSSPVPLFQNESRYETIHMKMTLICMKMKLQVELSFALRLVLKQRHKITRKWPIKLG